MLARAQLSNRPSVLRFVFTASRASRFYHLSAVSHDVWTWHTRPAPSATVPARWICPATDTRRCAVQPMITLNYAVAGLTLDGAAHSGRQSVTVTAMHIQPARPGPIASVTAQVSLDNGRTWQTAQVTRVGPRQFRITFTAPAAALVSLRVTAADPAGNSVAETISNAYRTTP